MLAMAEERVGRDLAFGRLLTQAALCRAGLRLLATAPAELAERVIRDQLRTELRSRFGADVDVGGGGPDPGSGPSGGGANGTEAA